MPALAPPARPWVHTGFRAMGTDVRVTVLAETGSLAERCADRAAPELERLEARWSRFRPESELCRLNAAAGAPVVVSGDTFAIIERAVDAWHATAGRFDPTVLASMLAVGYDRDYTALVRDDAREPSVAPAPGCAGIALDRLVPTVWLPDGVALDLGGIGKGLAADRVARGLLGHGADGVCVDLGGDLHVGGASPEPGGWTIRVDDPLETGATGTLVVGAGGVATSTRLRRTWTRAGRAQHHIIDPRAGSPVWSGLASVTVVAAETWWAEVLAKAAFVAGPVAGPELLADAGVTGLLVLDDGRVVELPGLDAFRPERG